MGLAALAGAIALRFTGLGHQSFWYDETVTVSIIRGSFGSLLSAIPHTESTPPLYYVLAWAWTKLAGTSEAGVRSLSALAGVAAVPVAWAATRRLVSRRAGLIAAGLVAANPILVWYSQEARAYSLLVLLGSISFLFFVRSRDEPSRRSLIGWSTASCLALLTHYFAVFLIAAELAWLLAELRAARQAVFLAATPIILVGLALLPLAHHQERGGRTAWIGASSLGGRIGDVARELGTANVGLISSASHRPHGGLGPIALALVLGGLLITAFLTPSRERRGALIAGAVGFGSLLLALLPVPGGLDFFKDRNLLAAWVPLLAMLAAGLAARRTRGLGLALALGICGLGVAVDIQVARDPDLQRANWRALARSLGPVAQTRALTIVPGYASTPLQVYGQALAPAMPGLRVHQLILLGALSKPAPMPGPPAGLTLVQERSYPELRLLRYQASGYLILTSGFLASARGRVVVQPGPALRIWLARYLSQLVRWRAAARAVAAGRQAASALPGLLASPPGLLAFPPELAAAVRLRQRLRRAVAAAGALDSQPASLAAARAFSDAYHALLRSSLEG